jgi:hypothetical protein
VVLVRVYFRPRFSRFCGSSVGVMVGQMLRVLLGIMVSQSMPLLVGGVADPGQRLVESKLLEWLRSGAASWCAGRDGVLLECGDLDCCVFAEYGGGSSHLKGGVALAPGSALKRLGGLLRPMFLFGLDLVLWGWWLLRLVIASWLDVSSALKSVSTDGALLLHRLRRRTCVLGSCGDSSLQQYNHLYPPCVVLLVCVPTLCCYVYKYK